MKAISQISIKIIFITVILNTWASNIAYTQKNSIENKKKKKKIAVIDEVKYKVETIKFSQKTDVNGIKHIKEELIFTDTDGNVFFKKTSKSFEPARKLSIVGGFILDKAIFDMKMPENKGLRKKIFGIIKEYLLYKKNGGENPLIINVASSPEYKGTYEQAKEHNYSLVIQRAKVVSKILKIYAKKINPAIPLTLTYEIPIDGMNFPLEIRKKIDKIDDLEIKNTVYQEFIKDKNQEYLKTLRRAEILFEIEPKILHNDVIVKSFVSTKVLKAALVLNDPSPSMENDVLKVKEEIKEINLERKSKKYPTIKVEDIFVKKIVGDNQAEMHLETLDWYINGLSKMKIKTTNNIIVVFTDEPDSSYRSGTNVDVKERYISGLTRIVKKLKKMNYNLLFVIKNPSDAEEERVIDVNEKNLLQFSNAFYDTRSSKTNTKKLEVMTQNWYNEKIKPIGKKTTPVKILKNQLEHIKVY